MKTLHIKYRLLLFFLLSLCFSYYLNAEITDFKCMEKFDNYIRDNEMLELSGIDIIEMSDGSTYLLGLGTAKNKAKDSSDAKARLNTRKTAESKARKQIAEFLKTEIKTKTKLTEIKQTEKVQTDKELQSKISKILKVREEIIVERAYETLGGSKAVASWFSEENELFNVVVAIEFKKKDVE